MSLYIVRVRMVNTGRIRGFLNPPTGQLMPRYLAKIYDSPSAARRARDAHMAKHPQYCYAVIPLRPSCHLAALLT